MSTGTSALQAARHGPAATSFRGTARGARVSVRLFLATASLCSAPAFAQETSLEQQLAVQLIQARDYAQAAALLERIHRATPEPEIKYLLGYCLTQQFQYEAAEKLLREASRAEPKHHYFRVLAKILLEQGKNREALRAMNRALALVGAGSRPPPPPARLAEYHFSKAMCAINTGDLALAEAEFEACLALTPKHDQALFELGRILASRAEDAAALEKFQMAVKLSPTHVEARFCLGLAQSKLGRTDDAVRTLRKVLRQVAGHVGATYSLGRLLVRAGERDEGMRLLREFKRLSQSRDEIDFVRHTLSVSPDSPSLRLQLAELLLDAGRVGECLSELRAARRLGETPVLYRLMARVFRAQGRPGDADRAEERVRQLEEQGR